MLFQDNFIFINILLFFIIQFFMTAAFIKDFSLSAIFSILAFGLVATTWFVTNFVPQYFDLLYFLANEQRISLLIITQAILLLIITNLLRNISDKHHFWQMLNYQSTVNFKKGIFLFAIFFCLVILEYHLMLKGAFFPNLFMIVVLFLVIFLLFYALTMKNISYQRKVAVENLELTLQEEQTYYEKAREYRHDFRSILVSLQAYLDTDNLCGAKQFLTDVLQDSAQYFDNYHFLQLTTVSNPAVKGLLLDFIARCKEKNIPVTLEINDAGQAIPIPLIDFLRCLSIVMNNALESTQSLSKPGKIQLSYYTDTKDIRFLVKNSVIKKPDITQILKKGSTSKVDHEGLGLPFIQKMSKIYSCFDFFISSTDSEFSVLLHFMLH